ncbi:MAG: hypothetical protein OIF40_14535 [Mangrovicoccus sp.]|nr:hypothetical protein [Mangrovicoccus sp.]
MARFASFLVGAAAFLAGPALAETRLMMVEQSGCHWCVQWHKDVGPEYPKTAEGQRAPLLRQDLGAPLPDGVTLTSRATYTPTFVLLQDGAEIARLEGYPGEDFFWPLLGAMLDKLPPEQAALQ